VSTEGRGVAAERSAPPRPFSLWRNRNYLLLLSGQSVSVLGSQISSVAYPLLALALTGSAAQAGLVGAGSFVSYLVFTLFAGVWVDRMDRRVIMIACEAGQAFVAGSIPLAAVLGRVTVPQLIVASTISTALYIFFNAASIATLPRVVPPDQLTAAVARDGVIQSTTALGGPPLGGLIFQSLGKTIPMLFDAVSYAASAVTLVLLRASLRQEQVAVTRHIGREIAEALAWLRDHALVRSLMLSSSVLFFITNASRFSLIVLAKEHGASAAVVGLLLAAGSVGSLLGALAAPRVQRRVSFRRIIVSALWAQAAFCPLYAVAPGVWGLAVVWGAVSFVWAIYNVPTFGYQIAATPDEMQGRVQSVGGLLFFGPSTLSAAFAGMLLQTVGPTPTVLIFAAILLVVALAATRNVAIKAAPARADS